MIDEDMSIKIADFGFAAPIYGNDLNGLLYSGKGTPQYAAPEIIDNLSYNGTMADIFSLGVTLFTIVFGCQPFYIASRSDQQYYNCIINGDYETYWDRIITNFKIKKISKNFVNLFSNMISFDPTQRPSITEIRNHPWMWEHGGFDIGRITNELSRRSKLIKKKKDIKDDSRPIKIDS